MKKYLVNSFLLLLTGDIFALTINTPYGVLSGIMFGIVCAVCAAGSRYQSN